MRLQDPSPAVNVNDAKLFTALALAGALPFAACALMPWVGIVEIPGLGRFDAIAAAYALTIASFMAGVHWGTYLYCRDRASINLFVTSNVAAVAVWLGYLALPRTGALLVAALTFALLLAVDLRLYRAALIDRTYVRIRIVVTAIVLVCLVAVIAALPR